MRRFQVKVEDQRLLDAYVELHVLLLGKFCIVLLLQKNEPLCKRTLEEGVIVQSNLLLQLLILLLLGELMLNLRVFFLDCHLLKWNRVKVVVRCSPDSRAVVKHLKFIFI